MTAENKKHITPRFYEFSLAERLAEVAARVGLTLDWLEKKRSKGFTTS